MRFRAICAVAAALVITVSAAVAEEAQDCRLVRQAELDVTLDLAKNPMVPMTVAGHRLMMLVDTGSIYSMIVEHRIDELGLSKIKLKNRSFSSNGKRIDHYVEIPELQLGRMRGDRTQMLVLPEGIAVPDVDGTLAPDYLSLFDIELDLSRLKINLFSPKTCDTSPIYWAPNYAVVPLTMDRYKHIFTKVTLDGKELKAEIDTGSSISFMSLETATVLLGVKPDDPALKVVIDGHGVRHGQQYPFKTLEFGTVKVENPSIVLDEKPLQAARDMVIGMKLLRKLRMYISYKEAKIYATAAAPVAAQPPSD